MPPVMAAKIFGALFRHFVENLKKNTGADTSLGLDFWIFPWFPIGFPYSAHIGFQRDFDQNLRFDGSQRSVGVVRTSAA